MAGHCACLRVWALTTSVACEATVVNGVLAAGGGGGNSHPN